MQQAFSPSDVSPPGADRLRIGIITGSGPEAGIDLWSKLLVANRQALGSTFRGDVDSPEPVVISEPSLGLSMEIERNDALVWRSLLRTADAIRTQVDVFTVACNTLHYYADRIREVASPALFVDVADVVRSHLARHPVSSIAILGAAPVASLGRWSPCASLAGEVEVEGVSSLGELHALIHKVKLAGRASPEIEEEFAAFVGRLSSEVIILACTELPLIDVEVPGKVLVDVNRLLAERLVELSLGAGLATKREMGHSVC